MLSAKEVLDRYWNGTIPVNPVAIALAMGVKVYRSSNKDILGEFYFFNNSPVILLYPSGSLERDRFTIAHELGHYALDHGPRYRNVEKDVYQHVHHDSIEREANRFAAELLMPADDIRFGVMESSMNSIGALSRCFQVSNQAMKIRLEQLGYL